MRRETDASLDKRSSPTSSKESGRRKAVETQSREHVLANAAANSCSGRSEEKPQNLSVSRHGPEGRAYYAVKAKSTLEIPERPLR